MNFSTLSSSQKLPDLNKQKFLITEPDDKGFAKDQFNKIVNRIQIQKELKLKPWEKKLNNIYSHSGRSNHQILRNIRNTPRSKTIDIDDLINNKDYYNQEQLHSINDSLNISKQVQLNSFIKRKIKLPIPSLKSYILETKQICKNKIIADLVKNERDKIIKKQNEYYKALKHEIKNLNRDILKFELFATNERFEKNQKFKYINSIEKKKKSLLEEIKELSQEYHSLKANIQKILRYINDKKIYVNFVTKLLGGESIIGNLNLDGLNIQKMEDIDLHFLIIDIVKKLRKNNFEESIFITSTDEELMESINKIDIIFKVLENKILKTLSYKENIRQELIELKKNQKIIKKELESRISNAEIEYIAIMQEYEVEEDNNNYKSHSPEDFNNYIRILLNDFYIYLNNDFIKNKEEVDEYNIISKVVKPAIDNIKEKEKQIDEFLFNMEKYSEEDSVLFNKCVNKIKNENKLKKYYREKENKEIEMRLKNSKIMEKYNRIFVKERNKFKMLAPLSLFRKARNIVKEQKTETADFKLLYY